MTNTISSAEKLVEIVERATVSIWLRQLLCPSGFLNNHKVLKYCIKDVTIEGGGIVILIKINAQISAMTTD